MILLTHIILAVLILGLTFYFKTNQPENINSLYGYRTKSSMKSIDSWRAGNEFSNRLQVKFALLFIVFEVFSYFLVGGINSIILSCVFLTVTSIAVIPITESYLKKKFPMQ